MEEFIYILPFDQYGYIITIFIIVCALVLFSILMRVLKIPQKFMVIFTGALAMMVLFTFQIDNINPVQSLIGLAKRQKQLDQQFRKAPIHLGDLTLINVKVRVHLLELTIVNNKPLPHQSTTTDLNNYALSALSKNFDRYCRMLELEQALPYRQMNNEYFSLDISQFIIQFISDHQTAMIEIPVEQCSLHP